MLFNVMSLFKVGVCMWEGAKPEPGAPPPPTVNVYSTITLFTMI